VALNGKQHHQALHNSATTLAGADAK